MQDAFSNLTLASFKQPSLLHTFQDQNTQRHVESFAIEAFETLTSEKEVAAAIRERMDTSYGPYWNVIVRIPSARQLIPLPV